MKRPTLHRLCRGTIRWAPVVGAILMCVHCLALLLGFGSSSIEFIFDSSLVSSIVMMVASYAMEFCVWHRVCIIYAYIVTLCVDYHRNIGFGEFVTPMRWIVFVSGIIIVTLYLIKSPKSYQAN